MRRAVWWCCLWGIVGCAAGEPSVTVPSDRGAHCADVSALLATYPLAEGQNIRAVALGRTESLSYHLVQVRDREAPHVHATHDLAVTLLRGQGALYIRGRPYAMRTGDVAVVPHGTPHYFVNTSRSPAAAFATFAPPYDGTDQLPVSP